MNACNYLLRTNPTNKRKWKISNVQFTNSRKNVAAEHNMLWTAFAVCAIDVTSPSQVQRIRNIQKSASQLYLDAGCDTHDCDMSCPCYTRVCFSTNLPTHRRISSFLDYPHLPSFACDSKSYNIKCHRHRPIIKEVLHIPQC